MFKFLRQKFSQKTAKSQEAPSTQEPKGVFTRIQEGLARTRAKVFGKLTSFLLGKKAIDADVRQQLETLLLTADVGVRTTEMILTQLPTYLPQYQQEQEPAVLALSHCLLDILKPVEQPLMVETSQTPFVLLVVGVNGSGKTTTIGKLTHHYQAQGHRVLLAAGDTFRAAATEQLQAWGARNEVPVISQHQGADSASVIFDAVQAAEARGYDLVIADTAGRLHTQSTLMAELEKIVRVLRKRDPQAPHEILLVLDGGTGQTAITQVKDFQAAIGVTGLAITKLDGTAKGGAIFPIACQCQLPIRFIGVGEQQTDLKPFIAEQFIQALLCDDR